MAAPDFVVVGHVTLDKVGDGVRPGGAALYAAIAAHRLGLSVGVLTSHGDEFPVDALPPQVEVVNVDAVKTTTFEIEDKDGVRGLKVVDAANPLGVGHVPEDWLDAPIVLLAPVFNEVDPRLATAFADAAVGAAAQGWLRGLGAGGTVAPVAWTPPAFLLGRLQALFLSREDVGDHMTAALDWFEQVPIGVLTAGADGALLFVNAERYEVRPRPAREVDGTGAGDVFAATFLVAYQHDADAWDAAAAAACAGSLAVEGAGPAAIPTRAELDAAVATYHLDD